MSSGLPDMELLPAPALREAAECLKVLAHPVRLRIVDILMQGQFPVSDIADMCDVQPHQCSEHLRLLQGHGLLQSKRSGRCVYYRISDRRLPEMLKCVRRAYTE